MLTFTPSEPLDADFRGAVANELDQFLAAQESAFADLGVSELFSMARDFAKGGKRIRPAFCFWSYVALTDAEPTPAVLRAAASLDLLHVSALVHDDIIDASATRRGLDAAHVQFANRHLAGGGVGDPDDFGLAGGIILGDLLLTLSGELFDRAGLTPQQRARAEVHLHAMRTEVALGQYLDARSQTLPALSPADQLNDAVMVTEYKTARYSVRRPAQLGGAIAGATDEMDEALANFGSPLGRAFQMRDDVLGVFGDPKVTGKPAGDDLREGKRTVLVALALTNLDDDSAVELSSMLGDQSLSDGDIDRARAIITQSGARELVEQRIADEYVAAMKALEQAPLTASGATALARLAELSIERDA